jgi:hypothetical protein
MACTYYETLALTAADSSVTWQNYNNDAVAISGAVPLSCNWTEVSMGNVTAYSCSVDNSLLTSEARALVVGGSIYHPAR